MTSLRVVGRNHKIEAKEYQLNMIKTYQVDINFYRSITIDDVARNVNMNRTSFCRFFKHMGMSFVNYLNDYRIAKACELLKKSDLNISQVCYKSGFNDIPYFCRVFRRFKRGYASR